MEETPSKPYRLINKIQHYNWGTKNQKAFIPNLLGINITKELPYAELWIGAHPKASSEILIDGEKFSLNEIIEKYPTEFLGKYVTEKFDGKLPFLLKVLSAANALSIQTHPNKKQAIQLHSSDPENYPDDNHKPEIAIAIDSLTAIAGFRPVKEIIANLRNNPEILEFADNEVCDKIFVIENVDELTILIKNLYQSIMKLSSNKEKLVIVIKKIIDRLSHKKKLTPEEFSFLKQHKLFSSDVGLFSFFFFNIIQLNPGQAIFTDAGIPHAYIEGNIIECMANSDNVVRAGLTNKFRDIETLLDIIKYDFSEYAIINKEQKHDEIIYKTIADEFEVKGYQKKSGFSNLIKSGSKPAIVLIIEGVIEVIWDHKGKHNSVRFNKGETFLIPSILPEYKLSCIEDSKYYIIEVP